MGFPSGETVRMVVLPRACALREFAAYRGPLHTVATFPGYRINETKLRQIKDGTTKTFLIGEYYTRTSPELKAVWGSPWRYHNKGHVHQESIYRTPDFDSALRTAAMHSFADGRSPARIWA